MHDAVCDKCRKDCQVPFRPTGGKPVYCNNCFERPSESRSGGDYQRSASQDRRMFDAVCDECKNNCQVPFQPSSDKPVYCSNCFGSKGGRSENRNTEESKSRHEEQFALLNQKVDQILNILMPIAAQVEEAETDIPEEAEVQTEEIKAPKKTSKRSSGKSKE